MTSKDDALTEEEFTQLYSKATSLKDKIMILMLGVIGLRAGELAHMKSSWFKGGKLRIPSEQPCSCSECVKLRDGIWTPKTKKAVRSLKIEPVSPELWMMCRKYFAVHDNYGRTRATIWHILKKLAKQTDITHRVYPHALRSTAATKHGSKMTTPTLMYWMGWRKLSTADLYVREHNVDEEVERVYR